MTAFGKILIFLNLVFAMLTGGLIGMVYLTRVNWKDGFTKIQAASQAADASYKQMLADDAKQLNDKDRIIQQGIRDKDKVNTELAAAKTQIEQLQSSGTATKRTNDKDSENVKTLTAELERRKAEVKQLGDGSLALNTRIRDLERQLTKTRDESVNNKLNYDSLKERYQNLLGQNEDLQREITAVRNPGSRAGAPSTKGPPPEQVRGTVKAVDGNLATVSVGTDSGVNKDNTLFLFRLTPAPEYLGKLTILSATPFEAVGRIEPAQRRSTIKPGDEVGSRIAGLK